MVWLTEVEAKETGKPLFKQYGKKFPKGYLSKTQCRSLGVSPKENEEPIAFKRNNVKGLYFPLYDRTNLDIWEKVIFMGERNVPNEFVNKYKALNMKMPVQPNEEPAAYLQDGQSGGFTPLYKRSR